MKWITVKYFPLEQNLYELTEYLRAQDLDHRITREGDQHCLWVRDEAIIPVLQEFLIQYSQGTADFKVALMRGGDTGLKQGPSFRQQAARIPIAMGLIALSFLGFIIQQGFFGYSSLNKLTFFPFYYAYERGELWRILTPAFIHFSIFHVVLNCLCVWDLGRRLEPFFGKLNFLLFFAITAIAANVAQFYWSGSTNFGGISGFICAMVGFIAVRRLFDKNPLIQIPWQALAFVLIWLVLCMIGVVELIFSISIANAAHAGGLIAGAIYALVTKKLYRR